MWWAFDRRVGMQIGECESLLENCKRKQPIWVLALAQSNIVDEMGSQIQ